MFKNSFRGRLRTDCAKIFTVCRGGEKMRKRYVKTTAYSQICCDDCGGEIFKCTKCGGTFWNNDSITCIRGGDLKVLGHLCAQCSEEVEPAPA